uniref:Uncharacterized protein n=1 Tax=Periophthalmus magnuspinnatus TaxID=409849 RepID=A0A3B4BI69_9GOBI
DIYEAYKNVKRPGERRGLDLGDAHSYSQWQACLWAALCLNQVLLQPVPDPYLPWLFSGTLVHGLAKYFKEGHAPESLLHKYTSCEQLYSSLLDTVNRSVLKSHPVSSASGRRKRSGRGRKRGSARGRGYMSQPANSLKSCQHVDDLSHSCTFHSDPSPWHRCSWPPFITCDIIVFY